MSGEGSSLGTKCRRGASTRSQGAAQEQPADLPLRVVSYRGAWSEMRSRWCGLRMMQQ
ncbi:hypothetical protein HanRHA438_Chr01g0039401 [Helianthus annuus]|nr:hypothetical protein HanXRQr2_Chr01g0038371 [Helianthus annuus]KAJ0628165.1 hypothetical protein HanHA89_Chr01g0033721 [Helianthus annuus]KAJ0784453.1 hypothetical protein HanLR1_Chr01g0032221 [Helianthus annuus]KAJ0949505.1 hypothetical protein HanRHA438_Chr01g0039401 [Helianthus annuus]